MLCYERNVETNARLEAAGVEVIRIPGSELAGARGGPRALSCAVSRDSAAEAAAAPALTLVPGQTVAAEQAQPGAIPGNPASPQRVLSLS
jgi:hypothetical protein